jgi:hypothetical protein
MTELNYDLFGNVAPAPKVKMSTPSRRPVPKHNPKQLYLFASGDEIMNHVQGSVDAESNSPEDMRALWRQKRHESWDRNYPQKFSKEGIKRPITVMNKFGELIMGQGHHRVASAHELNRLYGQNLSIPVVYDRDFDYTGTENNDRSWYHADYPFGPEGRMHEFAKNAPPGKWAGLPAEQVDKNFQEYLDNQKK